MAENSNSNNARLVMINPNSVYGDNNGKPLTPPYEDMCISVNLEVEVIHRTKTDNIGFKGGKGESSTFFMNWTSAYETDENANFTNKLAGTNNISFLEGDDARLYSEFVNGKSYLTTYYTDISLNDIKERNIVEGLGITNVDISYDNMYMPTITIKFVDVRGSSIFGREEAVHNKNQLTSETIFGCFFTLPYPKFKLHVKGFYGNAVTYQLACTGFKANLNSQNGNFEITTTFIGYQFSLLTDIPFGYLLAAPYCDYVGKKYWEEHVDTPSWELAEGKKMMKLYDIYTSLKKNLINNVSVNVQANTVDNSSKSIAIQQLWSMWENIKAKIRKRGKYLGYETDNIPYRNDKNVSYYLFLNDVNITCSTHEIESLISEFTTSVNQFNTSYPDYRVNFDINDYYRHYDANKWLSNIVAEVNGQFVISQAQYEENALKECVQQKLTNGDDFFNQLLAGCTLTDGGFEYSVNEIKDRINNEYAEQSQRNVNYVPQEIENSISFKPSIGNFFKIIIAHLETFCAMIYECSSIICQQIQTSNGRSPETLGVNIKDTDVATTTKFIPPFPAIYSTNNNNNNNSSSFAAMGWVGDFSSNFEEEKLIVALLHATQHVSDEIPSLAQQHIDISKIYPSMPLDLYTEDTSSVQGTMSLDMIAAHLGFRMTQIFGILNNGNLSADMARLHGKMDALNFYQSISKKDAIRDMLFKDIGNGQYEKLNNVIKEILICSNNQDAMRHATCNKHSNNERYGFEYCSYGEGSDSNENNSFNYQTKSAAIHPVYIPTEGNYTYTYLWGGTPNNEHAIVPVVTKRPQNIFGQEVLTTSETSNLHNIKLHAPKLNGYTLNKPYPLKTTSNLLHNINSKSFLHKEKKSTQINYINNSMFNIITNKEDIKVIIERFNKLNDGIIEVEGYTGQEPDFKKLMNRYYDMNINQYFDENLTQYLAKKKPHNGNDTLAIYTKDKEKLFTDTHQFELTVHYKNKEDLNSKLEFIDAAQAFESNDLSEYFVPYTLCKCRNSKGEKVFDVSLDITNAFINDYQDFIKNTDKNSTEDKLQEELLALRCWMLLHAVPLKWEKVSNLLRPKSRHGYVKRVPLAMVLLLGGAIYFIRKYCRFAEKNTDNNSQNPYVFKTPSTYRKMIFNQIGKKFTGTFVNAIWNGMSNKDGVKFPDIDALHTNIGWNPFFVKDENGKFVFTLEYMCSNETPPIIKDGLTYFDLFNPVEDDYKSLPDYYISNKLMEVFINWFKTDGKEIIDEMLKSTGIGNWGYFSILKNIMKGIGNYLTNGKFYVSDLFNMDDDQTTVLNTINEERGGMYCCTRIVKEWGKHLSMSYGSIIVGTDTVTPRNKAWDDLCNKEWMSPNDKHWTAVDEKDKSFVAYFQSDAPFMNKLVELYTRDCIICLNDGENNKINLVYDDFVEKE